MEKGLLPAETYNNWSKVRLFYEIQEFYILRDLLLDMKKDTTDIQEKINYLENLLNEKDSK